MTAVVEELETHLGFELLVVLKYFHKAFHNAFHALLHVWVGGLDTFGAVLVLGHVV